MLVIKTDAIGDYILFRNYLEILKRSEKYKDFEITLLGNRLWKDIAEKYDSSFVDHFIFISANDLYESPLQVLKLSFRLFRENYQLVLQPTYTRTLINDFIAGVTVAERIIGFESDNESILPRYKTKTDKFYTQKLGLPDDVFFEFDRSKFFFEKVLDVESGLNAPFINMGNRVRNGIVIVPGAGVASRCWEADKFVNLIRLILGHGAQTVYLEGSPIAIDFDATFADDIASGRLVNLIGKTSLIQLIELIGQAKLLIANETSGVHIAVACRTKAVCVTGGGHFARFAPYPAKLESRPVCVYHQMECYNCNWNCIFKVESQQAYPCIGNISVSDVWNTVSPLLT